MNKPRIMQGPHYIFTVIGIDGSFISDAFWHKEWADQRCQGGCRVERFRLVRDPVRKKQKKALKKKHASR